MSASDSNNRELNKGDKIEVLRNADDGYVQVWFPATVIDSPSPAGKVHLKFHTLFTERRGKRKKIRDYVDVAAGVIRPVPPAEPHRCFAVGEEVEVFHDNGWRKGELKDVPDDLKYKVAIGVGVEVLVDKWRVRVLRDWKENDRSCVTSPLVSPQLDSQSKKVSKIRIICSSIYHEGTRVEVKSDEEGYHGCWYTATVVGSTGKDELLVQYDTLLTDDEMQLLVETAYSSHVRPIPPIINRIDRFKMVEEVDAWYNDGWWVGVISKVLSGLKYGVYFWTTNEEFEFEHNNLRSHQELINGKWVASFLRPKVAAKSRLEKVKIQKCEKTSMAGLLRGLRVEIAHGVNGYCTIWYPAVIVGPLHNGNYVVEYRTLKTDNGRELIKEEADALCIRPSPRIIQRAQHFQAGDAVDAWDHNGWRCGQVCRTVKGSKYVVYFCQTNSMVEFPHADLRPSQHFVDGAWSLAS